MIIFPQTNKVSITNYFSYMFSNCYKFNADLSEWDVSSGKYFQYMFYGCKSFDADLSKWNILKAETYDDFATNSLLEKYPNRIPERFKSDYLK